jgi:hypothetical protein
MATLTYKKIAEALGDREPFKGNSMRAEYAYTGEVIETGRLSDFDKKWLESEQELARLAGLPFYVVYSYATPIAWAYGTTVSIPDVRYSPTTSKQQTRVRVSLRP